MKIFITGATGYIGNKLAMEAALRGHQVHILVRDKNSRWLPEHGNITAFGGDIEDRHSIVTAMRGCEAVFHLAAVVKFSSSDRSIFYNVNVEGTRNMLDAAMELNVRKFLFTSSGAVMGPSAKFPLSEDDPRIASFENDYEISKYWAEQLVKKYSDAGLDAVIVSPTGVYGPGLPTESNVFRGWITALLSYRVAFLPGNGERIRNFAYVDDVVNGHFLALEKGRRGEKYILGGENISYNTLVEIVRRIAGKKIYRIHSPVRLLKAWAAVHQLIHRIIGRPTHISPALIQRLMVDRALSCSKAIDQLGYSVTSIEEGMRHTIATLTNNRYA
ncbi:MAG TPA: NAD-dependent epimerase/dehydratase family protein [Chitinophagaceae bacterium]|nr:NAD-dependent epimerase/dehydratase family protein [Chitinophagaceae bacterium]